MLALIEEEQPKGNLTPRPLLPPVIPRPRLDPSPPVTAPNHKWPLGKDRRPPFADGGVTGVSGVISAENVLNFLEDRRPRAWLLLAAFDITVIADCGSGPSMLNSLLRPFYAAFYGWNRFDKHIGLPAVTGSVFVMLDLRP